MKRSVEPVVPCSHLDRNRSGTSVGLERVVCTGCGHVSVRYLFDLLEHRYPMIPELVGPADDVATV